jgi:hypothetical protein
VYLCRFRLGRQEDAHEYLRCVLDAMHEAFLKHIQPKPPPELAATTFIHRIFGGKLRSEVRPPVPCCLSLALHCPAWQLCVHCCMSAALVCFSVGKRCILHWPHICQQHCESEDAPLGIDVIMLNTMFWLCPALAAAAAAVTDCV